MHLLALILRRINRLLFNMKLVKNQGKKWCNKLGSFGGQALLMEGESSKVEGERALPISAQGCFG